MESQRMIFKWIATTITVGMFLSFAFVLPSASAQEENPLTPTPVGSIVTPEPIQPPETLQGNELRQMQSVSSPLAEEWSTQADISYTPEQSLTPKVASDNSGIEHFVWAEIASGGKQEIFYSQIFQNLDPQIDDLSQSIPVNVSNNPSFSSTSPQIVVDSAGTAHIVWQEEDNDHNDDYEVLYSKCSKDTESGNVNCTSPVVLSDGLTCSSNLGTIGGDWKAITPSIGIDADDNLLVVWMSYEPVNTIYTMYSLWSTSGQPPSNRTGCHPNHGLYAYPMVAGDSNGNFHLVMANSSYALLYSNYTNGGWSNSQNIGNGWKPVLYIDQNTAVHTAAWWNGTPVYWVKEGGANSWSSPENVFSGINCGYDISLITDGSNLPRLTCVGNSFLYQSSRQSEGWTEAAIIAGSGFAGSTGAASQPNLAKDINGNLHLVWTDFRTGNGEIFYSPSYSCEGIEPATTAGQEVLAVLQGYQPEDDFKRLNYCKNQVEEAIFVPFRAEDGPEKEAFKQWKDLASSATHEVAFTVMFWDERGSDPYPGEIVLQGINQLYADINNPLKTNKYPHGMTVRILLGVQTQWNEVLPDQRAYVLDELYEQGIPNYKVLSDGRIWKVEVGLYRDGGGISFPGLSTNKYSHVKLMVVDNNKMIVSGYHPQYDFGTTGNKHDLGLMVSGPIAANGMAIFDSLWAGSEVLCTEEDSILEIFYWGFCHRKLGENPTHWLYPVRDDIVFPLFRNHDQKAADKAVQAAIGTANTQVYVMQNRFVVPGPVALPFYLEKPYLDVNGEAQFGLLEYADALLNVVESNPDIDIRIIVSRDSKNINVNSPSVSNFLTQYKQRGGTHAYEDVVRFYQDENIGVHTKSFMIDGEFLVIGSQNFDNSAFGSNSLDLDLVEYSLGIEDIDTISTVRAYLDTVWENSISPVEIDINDTFLTKVEQASPGSVIIVEPGVYETDSMVTVPEGVTLFGSGTILKPAEGFTGQSLLNVTDNNVTIMGLTIQDSPGYGIEIGDGSTALENINLSRIVFVNNALGGVYIQGPASGAASYTIENNTFAGGGAGVAISAGASTSGVIRDNIFSGQSVPPIQIASADDGSVEYAYNLFHNCAGGSCASGWHTGSLGAASSEHDSLFDLDPMFVNPAADDYQLSPASPAIDAGDPNILHEMVYDGDGDGQPRMDLGAFEYLDMTAVTPPSVQAVTRASADPTGTSSVNFTVTFSEAVTGVDTSDFTLTTSGVSGATVSGASGSGSSYTVTVSTGNGNGTIRLDVLDNDSIIDADSSPLSGAFTSGEVYAIDKSPFVLSSTLANPSPTNASSVDFTVTFSEDVTGVDVNDFTLTTDGVSDATISGVSGSGNSYTVTVNTGNGNGTIRLDMLDDDTILDSESNPLSGGFTDGETYIIDKSPFVLSSLRADPNPTQSPSVNFTVTFSEDVTGVDIGDFTLNTTNIADAAISEVNGSGSVYTVTVTTGSGSGTIRLDVVDDDTIENAAGTKLGNTGIGNGDFAEGEAYTMDFDSPVVVSSVRINPNPTQADTVGYLVTFSEPVTGVDIDDFDLTMVDISDGVVLEVIGSNDIYTVLVYSGTSEGTLRLGVVDNDTIEDLLGNKLGGTSPNNGNFISGETYTIDKLPVVLSSVLANSNPTSAESVDFIVTFSEPVIGIDTSDFELTVGSVSGAIITSVSGSGSEYTVTVSTGTDDGTIRLDLIDDDTVEDISGNKLGGTGTGTFTDGETYTVSKNAPIVLSITRADENPSNASSAEFIVTFSKPVVGVDSSDFELTMNGNVTASYGYIGELGNSGTVYTVAVDISYGSYGSYGTLGLNLIDDDTIEDNSGNKLGGMGIDNGSFTSGETYTIDQVFPFILSSIRNDTSPTNANSVDFTVTFSEPVMGVDISDFGLTSVGISGANVAVVSGSGSEYIITVHTGAGVGTIRLDTLDDGTIMDAVGNSTDNGDFVGGESYTIDKENPVVLSSTRNDSSPTNASSVEFTVVFSETVTGVNLSDFELITTGITGASITEVNGSGNTYTVLLETGSGNGTIRLDVKDDDTILDVVGNALGGVGINNGDFGLGQSYIIEQQSPPTVYTLVLQPNGTGGVDTYLLSGAASSNYGGNTGMGIGEKNSAVGSYARALIKFDLSALPSDAVITSADLSLWTSTDYADNDGTINVFRLKKPFNETQATWNLAATGVNWQSPGAGGAEDRESIAIGSVQISASEAAATEKQISLSPEMIQEMFNGTFTNNGFLLATSAELNDRFDFKTSDVGSSLASQRPKLVIQYTSASTNPPPANLLFTDGFESGDFSAWSSSTLDGGDLSVSATAAMTGANGMQALVNDLNSIYVADQTPTAEAEFRARFQFDPNSIGIPNNNNFTIASGSDISGTAWRITLNYSSGTYKLQGWAMTDAGVWSAGTQVPIQDMAQTVEIEYKSIANAGYLKLWINDTLMDTIANVDNDTMTVGTFYLGAVNGLDTGTSGAIYFDAVETYNAVR